MQRLTPYIVLFLECLPATRNLLRSSAKKEFHELATATTKVGSELASVSAEFDVHGTQDTEVHGVVHLLSRLPVQSPALHWYLVGCQQLNEALPPVLRVL